MSPENLYEALPGALPQELFTDLLRGADFRVERIVSRGHCSPSGFWYEQSENEWVLLLKGAARLRFEQQEQLVSMTEGDYLNIPAGMKHRVEWTAPDQDSIWLAIFYL